MGPQVLRWETLSKSRFDAIDRSRAVVLVTCSPLEVHGPHLPLGADALEGEGLVERSLRFLPERHADRPFLKLPMIYAATDTVPQPGSLFFRPATTVRVLTELGHTLAAQGFRHAIVSNFHGGPRHFLAIEKACTRVSRRTGLRMAPLFSLLISRLTQGTSNLGDVLGALPGVEREQLVGDTHGGLVETSQLLALHPDWVDAGHEKLPPMTVQKWRDDRGRQRRGSGARSPGNLLGMLADFRDSLAYFDEQTYAGAPASASAELGERMLDALGERAGQAATELLDGTIGPEDCHSPIWNLRFVFLNPLMIRLSNRLLGFRNAIA